MADVVSIRSLDVKKQTGFGFIACTCIADTCIFVPPFGNVISLGLPVEPNSVMPVLASRRSA